MPYFKNKESLVGIVLRILLSCGQLFGCSEAQSRAEVKQRVINLWLGQNAREERESGEIIIHDREYLGPQFELVVKIPHA